MPGAYVFLNCAWGRCESAAMGGLGTKKLKVQEKARFAGAA